MIDWRVVVDNISVLDVPLCGMIPVMMSCRHGYVADSIVLQVTVVSKSALSLTALARHYLYYKLIEPIHGVTSDTTLTSHTPSCLPKFSTR